MFYQSRTVRPHDPGLRPHHDIRNERYLIADALPERVYHPLGSTEPLIYRPQTVHHRQYAHFDQGATPECTGYGSVTLLASADPFNHPPISGHDWYLRNVAFDKAAGRDFGSDGGATVTAAMEVGRALGFYSAYRWAYTIRTMQQAIVRAPLIVGFNWYDKMWDRNSDNVVREPAPDDEPVGGHLFVLNAYDARHDLWRYPSTWGDGDYWLPGDLVYRLLREDGECAQPDEIKLPAHMVVPPLDPGGNVTL
jgi:hypothetical protein